MTRIDWRARPTSPACLKYRHSRVLLDGVDVTAGCFLADDDTGEVGHYLRDASGHFYRDGPFRAAQELRTGKVEIRDPA